MRIVIQRLSLGFVLIALSSAVLLLSDWGQRKGGRGTRIPRVAIVQHASQSVLDEGVRGMLDALAAVQRAGVIGRPEVSFLEEVDRLPA
jgi:hypothetical protein